MPEYGFSLTGIFPCQNRICPYKGKRSQGKPVFKHILRSDISHSQISYLKILVKFLQKSLH